MISNFKVYGISFGFFFYAEKRQNQNNLLIAFKLCIYIKSPIFSNSSHTQLFFCLILQWNNSNLIWHWKCESTSVYQNWQFAILFWKASISILSFSLRTSKQILIQLPRKKKKKCICMRAQHFQMQRPLHSLITSCMTLKWLPNEHWLAIDTEEKVFLGFTKTLH